MIPVNESDLEQMKIDGKNIHIGQRILFKENYRWYKRLYYKIRRIFNNSYKNRNGVYVVTNTGDESI